MSEANFVVPVRADQQQVLHLGLRQQILHQVQRRRIQPLQIVEEQGKRMFRPREYSDESAKYLLKPVLCVPRGKFGNGRLFSDNEFETTAFARLRFSGEEANQIIELAPATTSLKLSDFAANRDTVMTANLNQYRILHFATHGLLNGERPELSGLVLSMVDRKGETRDGFLGLHEIYNLRLNADLVVLSGCQTALGKDIRGEGLIGLTRGFMYAGTSRVIASLWGVDDHATAELMKRVYRGMLSRQMSPAAALKAAQTELRAERGWQAPYYWAAFTLEGDWR